ncbi:MAG: class I SAM-dependent methyltransferase [Candidatus Nanopelagicaceae bacterium]|nr:class I SAM-dependent methyltransferase [Candidatus Nanopelagicaceae bacterium]
MPEHYTETRQCRICAGGDFIPILDLGEQYIANAFHHGNDAPTLRAPLKLIRCTACGLVQLAHSIKRDLMYRSYWYKSGVNQTMRTHLKEIADDVQQHVKLRKGDKILDIGCNDCTLLTNYPKDVLKVGVDPSNIETTGLNLFINDYFTAEKLNGEKFKVITSIAMFYDLDDPKQFVQDIRKCLLDDGIWVLELSYLPTMLRTTSYDSICHEHVAFYCLETFSKVLEGNDLEIFDVKFNNMNGGSFRLFVAPKGRKKISQKVLEARDIERLGRFSEDAPYEIFTANVKKSAEELQKFLVSSQKQKVYGYGASTKGQVILQYCQFTKESLMAIAERNPLKHGLFTPGTNIKICSEEEMREAKPDYLLVFPWYFMKEFLEREKELLSNGCRFVQPLPEFKIL